jgi:acyl carrier protein
VVDLEAALGESIMRICGVPAEAITPSATLEELGLDSLAAAEVITDVEIRLGVELPMDILRGLNGLRPVGEVTRHLQAGFEESPVRTEP